MEFYKKYIENTLGRIVNTNINLWFGQEKSRENVALASNIIIEESTLQNSKELTFTRNKINRFSGGTVDRALFTQKSVFNGNTKLGIKIKKKIKFEDIVETDEIIIGLILLSIKDINNGLIALGGQTSTGKGIFEVKSVKLNGSDFNIDEKIEKVIGGEQVG